MWVSSQDAVTKTKELCYLTCMNVKNVQKWFYGRPHRALSRIREHDDFVSQQTEEAHQHLAGALEQAQTNSESVWTSLFIKHIYAVEAKETSFHLLCYCLKLKCFLSNKETTTREYVTHCFPLGFLSVVQGYHELYELHRTRLETQLLHMMKDRDCWVQLSLSLAKKVLNSL